ncbi:MAG: phage tail protein [Syntrophomonas sp.]
MLYIFDPDENLIALLKPDFTRSHGPTTTSRAFLMAEFPAEFDREPTFGCPYWDAVHHEILNGENTFKFTVPAGESDAAHVQPGNLVAFKDLDAAWQFFEIKRMVDLHGDGLTRTAYCEHILYELIDDIVTDKRPSAGATAALTGMLESTRWNVGIVDDLGTASTTAYYESALSAVQKVANAWKGELNWRCVITGGVITRYVDLLAMRGTDTGKQFIYGKDILELEREEDSTPVNTALYGRGKGVETESGEGYGRRLTFADIVWTTAGGDPVDKPAGQEWVGDPTALAQWGRPGGRHRFDIFTDEDETDPSVLLQKTWDALQDQLTPRVTYRGKVIALETLTGYSHEAVRLGDLTRAIDRYFRPELVVSARVIEMERDLLAPENTEIVLGSFAPTIVEATINTARRVDDLANKPYNTKWLDGVIDVLQNAIENSQAYIFETPQGTLHLNAPTYDQATEAMLLGGGRFVIANQKDGNGGWNWRTFGDGAGFTADLLNAGRVRAEFVQIGSLTEFEAGYNPVDNHLYFQYSIDGVSWHDTFNSATDLYMRQKVGDNGTWSEAARIAAVDGVNGADGVDGTPIIWKGDYASPPVNPQNGWAYRNTTDKKSYVYQDNTWYQMTIDGIDGINGANGSNGLSIIWKGDLTTPPLNPITNWAYRDTNNGQVYIYNGNAWELMVADGSDGIDGAPGADGMSVFITYNDNATNNPPATPTGDGTTNGWHTTPTFRTNWMSQKVAASAVEGTWGSPILISGGRKFTAQPVPPYDIGDLWLVSGANTKICIVARDSGAFVAADWQDTAAAKFDSPGYVVSTPEGIKVFDASNALRVLLGSWLKDTIRKYGLKIIGGEIYSSTVRSGAEDATTYIQFVPPNKLQVVYQGVVRLEISADLGSQITFKGNSGQETGYIYTTDSIFHIFPCGTGEELRVGGNLNVLGDMSCTGSKPAQQVTENYGLRYMYATEAPELVYYDRGVANLINGEVTVYFDPIYLECIEPDTDLTPWQIWVQAYGDPDVYVSEVGADCFRIKERNGGTSNNKVVWKHEAIRKGYVGIRLMEVTE